MIVYFWLIAAIILVIVEILTEGFGSICFAIGAGVSALASYLGANFTWQIIIFLAVSLLTFIFFRPFMLRFLDKRSKHVKTNVDALIGRKGIVSERIDMEKHTGRVSIDGDDWKAVSADGSVIERGVTVEIVKLDSIILTVKQLNK
ncbi:MAG: NfeD family protein [Bacteroidales bacterium]|jgi:membrane protein implicated in regulation of membrane protease activity